MRSLALFSAVLMFLVAGCASAPKAISPGVPPAAAEAPVVVKAPETASVAAQETVRRLLANDPTLNVAAQSRFLGYPSFVASLGGSIILESTAVQRSSASLSIYRVRAIEIHALSSGKVRVWAELANTSKEALAPQVFCRFNTDTTDKFPVWQKLAVMKSGTKQLVAFESPTTDVSRVTVLVR
jgi:hypothetical protein